MTGMRLRSVVSEAWRNTRSGTARPLLFTVLFLISVGALAGVDQRAVVGVIRGAQDFRDAGASTQIVEMVGGVDGAHCAALAEVEGVNAAGALRNGEPVRALSLPSTDLPVYEVTPGFLSVLGQPALREATGLMLSMDTAEIFGAQVRSTFATRTGSATVAAVFPYPDDGRGGGLSYAGLATVPATGMFDQCWVEVWPLTDEIGPLLRLVVSTAPDAGQVVQKQLNSRLGTDYDARALLGERPTRFATVGGVAVGLALGFAAIRLRRLELAAALHTRVSRTALTWQVVLETLVWVVSASIIAVPVLAHLAAWGNPEPAGPVWVIGMRVVLAAGAAAVVGAVTATMATRERHLFRYFKDR
ncbi:hypothetical protein SAMN05216410_0922 [Sanguibacter gelidistatuariae]|uniref:FtsX-like permease family protein n=1 Tax=Sanguibacter gelidistatuariae TaxID=1814289 RepID=A0A1G6HCR0_9MICO|nr:hypothetical protein [Sanguibacter gelidistatuariae]SDB91944.1 hypothetical protein SAMN05216410_0922 [Sanguibacter gelidistatuariae]